MKGYRITYEIVLDIYVNDNENRDKATEIGDELISNGEFESVPVKVEELEGGPYE